jgi:amidophosphoribosyltransferase
MLRGVGAKEVHLRIASPPVRGICPYGIDIPTREELIATGRDLEAIRDFVGADSLSYLSLEGMLEALREPGASYCDACFSGHYPIAFEQPEKPRPLVNLQR